MTNPDNALLPGMFVNAAVVLPPRPDTIVVPETAVEYTLYGDSVYVIRNDGKDADGHPILKAVRTPVKTGLRWDGKVAILGGLEARRAGRRGGPGQIAERRAGRRHRLAAAAAAAASDPALTAGAAAEPCRSPTSLSAGRCWRWSSAC